VLNILVRHQMGQNDVLNLSNYMVDYLKIFLRVKL